MTPEEVKEKVAALGFPIKQTTLQNYRRWGLVTPPTTKTLGRGKGRLTEYDPIVPGEIYAAQRMMKSDLGFSTARIARFRARFCALPNPDAPWPPDLITQAGALLWGLLRSLANHGVSAADELDFHIYPAEALAEVWRILRREEPRLALPETPDIPREKLQGLIVIRCRDGAPGLMAAMYPGKYEVLTSPRQTEAMVP